MTQYRKKPVVIDAIQWTGGNAVQVLEFAAGGPLPLFGNDFLVDHERSEVVIKTLEGSMFASVGDWIIRGIVGEYYPIKNSIFLETYEATSGRSNENM